MSFSKANIRGLCEEGEKMGKTEGLGRFKTAAVLAGFALLMLVISKQNVSFVAEMASFFASIDLTILAIYDFFKSL